MAWNSPHQSMTWTVGQQVGLPLGGYLRQVPSAARYRHSLQVIGGQWQEQELGRASQAVAAGACQYSP